MTIYGGCLCGKVRYRVTGPLIAADNCHCSMCRRQHGAAYASYADFKLGSLLWLSGEQLLKTYESASGAGWCFCRECGSTLAGTDAGVVSSIALGSVDGDPGIKPASHIFVANKAPWHDITDTLPQFESRDSSSERS